MPVIIISVIIIMFLILIAWTWNSLGNVEKTTKITCMIIGIVLTYIMTFIIFNISKIGIKYENIEAMKIIRRVFVILFAIINGYIILPYVFKKLEQINNDEIDKQKLMKNVIILLVIIVILSIIEIKYFGNVQHNVLNMIKK